MCYAIKKQLVIRYKENLRMPQVFFFWERHKN